MTRRQIDTSREMRLWIGQIVVPALTLAATTMVIPEVREAVVMKARSLMNKLKRKEEP